jgi:hypothetical protein
LHPLERLLTVKPPEWADVHRNAMAAGRGRVVHLEDERLAAAHELVALTLPGLPPLGAVATLMQASPELADECANALSQHAAAVLRLVDRALAAHGRDNGYRAAAWLEHAYGRACERATAAATFERDRWPFDTLVDATAEALAEVVIALHRDRLGVPEGLADALGSLLVLHAAARTGSAHS